MFFFKIPIITTLTVVTVVAIAALILVLFQNISPFFNLLLFLSVVTVIITHIVLLSFFTLMEDQMSFELSKPASAIFMQLLVGWKLAQSRSA